MAIGMECCVLLDLTVSFSVEMNLKLLTHLQGQPGGNYSELTDVGPKVCGSVINKW